MPRISAEHKQFYKAKIRSLLVQNPRITQRALQDKLKADGINLERNYLGSLLNSIYAERAKRADTITLNTALGAFAESMEEIVKCAWEIANGPWTDPKARVMALREIREAHNAVFEKLFDAGVFNRKLGVIEATIRNTPLTEDRKQAIRATFQSWGLLQAPKEDVKPANTSPTS